MLKSIHIENIAIMDNVDIEFENGFNVLTGQTGAGKSIIIDSINLLTGERSSKELVRTGAERALVEGVIYCDSEEVSGLLKEYGIELYESDPIILSREINKDGRGCVRINGRISTTTILRHICSKLINIHGQHDNQEILDRKYHLKFLDSYAKDENELLDYRESFKILSRKQKMLEEALADDGLEQQKKEMLIFQINELEEAEITDGEEKTLLNSRSKYLNNEKIRSSINSAAMALNGDEETKGAAELLKTAANELEIAGEFDEKMKDAALKIIEISFDAEDIARTVGEAAEFDDSEGVDINFIEQRLDKIGRLKRKYNCMSAEELNIKLEGFKKELYGIENRDQYISDLKSEAGKLRKEAEKKAEKLSKIRHQKAEDISDRIRSQLKDLEMPSAEFSVMFEKTELCGDGGEKAVFMISANKGEAVKPLDKVASGGELSRIILAIKTVLADTDSLETMVFDEVDTGVSGSTSQKIAEKLKNLAVKKQVFVITHSPQVAAFADFHYLVEKEETNGKTVSNVRRLNYEERIDEIARIISGTVVSKSARETAEELIKAGEKI